MKVKSVDIAKKLNISKATVSLALNNKPGVSEKTREKVLLCAEEMNGQKQEQQRPQESPKMIKIIIVNNKLNVVLNYEMDLWTLAFRVYDAESKRIGCTLGITFVEDNSSDIERAIEEANGADVAGVVLFATEMRQEQFEPFRRIKKPMIVYDNDLTKEYHCVSIDNVAAVREAVDYLAVRGCTDIKYLANKIDIYNFMQRRAGFRAGLHKNRLELHSDSVIKIGETIDKVHENMSRYLDSVRQRDGSYKLPDAFIMENYQVSVGVIHALQDKGISIPGDISLIGVDELPPTSRFENNVRLTTVKIEHAERARLAMMLLFYEMSRESYEENDRGFRDGKFKSYCNCEILPGNSVKVLNRYE